MTLTEGVLLHLCRPLTNLGDLLPVPENCPDLHHDAGPKMPHNALFHLIQSGAVSGVREVGAPVLNLVNLPADSGQLAF